MSNIVQYIMATLSIQRSTQRTFSIKEWAKVKGASVTQWLNSKNTVFSTFCEERVTNKEVVIAHAAVVLLLVACGVAEWLQGGCHV